MLKFCAALADKDKVGINSVRGAASVLRQLNSQGGVQDSLDTGERGMAQLRGTLSENLPILPGHVFRLNAMLSSPPVDLNRLSDADPVLVRQVIRCSNSALFDLAHPVSTIEQAVVSIGTDNLRTLILSCALVECVSRQLAPQDEQAFWRHGFLTAVLSERIGRWTEYPQPEQAYLAGLLHDVGRLPLLRAASRNSDKWGSAELRPAERSLEFEREHFGIDHAKLGHWIGVSWGFPAPLVEVFEFHHQEHSAAGETPLVSIVRAADSFCLTCRRATCTTEGSTLAHTPEIRSGQQRILATCLPGLSIISRLRLAEALESDFAETGQWLEVGLMSLSTGLFQTNPIRHPRIGHEEGEGPDR